MRKLPGTEKGKGILRDQLTIEGRKALKCD